MIRAAPKRPVLHKLMPLRLILRRAVLHRRTPPNRAVRPKSRSPLSLLRPGILTGSRKSLPRVVPSLHPRLLKTRTVTLVPQARLNSQGPAANEQTGPHPVAGQGTAQEQPQQEVLGAVQSLDGQQARPISSLENPQAIPAAPDNGNGQAQPDVPQQVQNHASGQEAQGQEPHRTRTTRRITGIVLPRAPVPHPPSRPIVGLTPGSLG